MKGIIHKKKSPTNEDFKRTYIKASLTAWETTEKVLLLHTFELLNKRIVSGLEKYMFLNGKGKHENARI